MYDKAAARQQQEAMQKQMQETLKAVIDTYHENPALITELLAFRDKFYRYSVKNTMLIQSQNPYSTYIASFNDWKNKGYSVRKGEKGLKIYVPVKTTFFNVETDGKKVTKQISEATQEEKEKIRAGEYKTYEKKSYRLGTVFDISQTTCPPEDYPKIYQMGYSSQSQAEIYDILKKFNQEVQGVSVGEADLSSISLRGTYAPGQKAITISDRLQDTQKLDTLIHEMGHAIMEEHRKQHPKEVHTAVSELEADAVSIMLQTHMGLELTDARKIHFVDHYQACVREQGFQLETVLNDVSLVYMQFRDELDPYMEKTQSQPPLEPAVSHVMEPSPKNEALKDQYLRTSRGQSNRPLYEASKEQLEQIKAAPILSVARDMGYHPVQRGRNWSLEEHDSVTFYQDTNSFYRFSKGVGGTPIDFVMHFGEQGKREAIQWLKERYVYEDGPFTPVQPQKSEGTPKPIEKKPFVLPEKTQGRYKRVMAYLTKTRCLDPGIVRQCMKEGLIYEDTRHNAVFVGKDLEGKAAYGTRHSTLTNSSFKGDISGSDQTLGFKVEGKNASRVYVTEAPIDALSLMSMDRQRGYDTANATYLATCGTGKTKVVERYLKEHPEVKNVFLANDNDPAGKEANRKITELIKENDPDIVIKELIPEGNDVNDMLKAIKRPEEQKKEREVKEATMEAELA